MFWPQPCCLVIETKGGSPPQVWASSEWFWPGHTTPEVVFADHLEDSLSIFWFDCYGCCCTAPTTTIYSFTTFCQALCLALSKNKPMHSPLQLCFVLFCFVFVWLPGSIWSSWAREQLWQWQILNPLCPGSNLASQCSQDATDRSHCTTAASPPLQRFKGHILPPSSWVNQSSERLNHVPINLRC